ncbi:MAG: exosortase/archaeosortase family protein [Sedimentisphaerales bacterium]|nr:exosortase/archaeosortase family protein [Sedimentisphaerales bacterium]
MTENYISLASDTALSDKKLNQWQQLGLHSYIKIAAIGAAFYLVFHIQIDNIVGRWMSDSSWSHGFIIPLFSLYFLNQSKHEILNLKTKPNYLGLLFVLCGLLFYPFNLIQFRFGYLNPLAMIATSGAIVLFLGGWKLVKYTWLPVSYLVFAVPLPDRYYRSITIPMRIWAASAAGALLNMVKDIEADVSGVLIDVYYKGQKFEPSLDVAEACSGMRLLMAFVALGVAMAYLHKRPFWQRLVLLLSTIPIAIFCNIVRVTVTGFIHVLIDPKYAQGIYHDVLGLGMLPLAFALYGAIAWFMSNLVVEECKLQPPKEDVVVRKDNTK